MTPTTKIRQEIFFQAQFKSYTKYELSNFRGSLVQGPSKPDLSGCALPYATAPNKNVHFQVSTIHSLRYWYKHVECISSRTSTSFKLRMEIKDNKRITNHNSSSIVHWSSCFLFSLSYFLPFNSIYNFKRCRRLHKIRTTYIMCRESYQSMAP